MKISRKALVAGLTLAPVAALPFAASAAGAGGFVVVYYKKPADQAAFEKYYFGTHAPLASKLPGLRSYVVSSGPIVGADGAPSAVYTFAAILGYDSVKAAQASLGSAIGAQVVGDLKNFAQAGVDISMFDTKTIV